MRAEKTTGSFTSLTWNRLFGSPPQSAMQELETQLKYVSIRGRMAFCITCLETIVRDNQQLEATDFDALLDALWDFVSSPDLSDWEGKIQPFIPELSANETNKLYLTLPITLLTCLDEIMEVGLGNLYSGVGSYSPVTLASTMRVAHYMLANEHSLPPLENFQRSPFTLQDQHGWGKRVFRSFFQ